MLALSAAPQPLSKVETQLPMSDDVKATWSLTIKTHGECLHITEVFIKDVEVDHCREALGFSLDIDTSVTMIDRPCSQLKRRYEPYGYLGIVTNVNGLALRILIGIVMTANGLAAVSAYLKRGV